MARNEAKIKFTAETGEFNKAIKQSNDEMSQLRAELKLNETQMKTTGASVEGLEKKHGLLEAQLKASESKTEALSRKVEKAAEIFGENSTEVTKLKTQLANAQTAEERLRQAVSNCEQELNDQKQAANEAGSATGQLTDKIKNQQTELTKLKQDYTEAVLKFGEASDEADELAREINDLSGELKENQRELDDAAKKADKLDQSLDDAGEAAESASDGFTVAKGVVADLASNAIQMAIGKVSEFIGWLKELPEATREIRQDFATLETSFETAGLSNEQATQTWKELYTVFGEDDRAVEAANLIAKMSDSQKDLGEWVTITKGIWGSYQDSLPVEGLAEASMETAKTGQVTGVLADALNWSSEAATMFSKYMSEDVTTAEDAFNEALKKCTTEEERQALITETLTALYGDAAKKYDEASGAQTAAKEATAENLLVQAQMAEAIEPVTTAWQGMKTEMLQGLLPVVQKVSDFFTEHPKALKAVAVAVTALSVAIGVIAVAWGVYTAAQWMANTAILGCPIGWIILAIVALVAVIASVVVYWDELKAAALNCWEKIKEAWGNVSSWFSEKFQAAKEGIQNAWANIESFFSGLWDGVVSGCQAACDWVKNAFNTVVDWINTNVIQPIKNFFIELWDGVKNIWNGICNAVQVAIMFIGSILSAAFNIITLPFRFIWENCKQYVFAAWEWIKAKVTTAVNAVRSVITKTFNAVKNFFVSVWNRIKSVFTTAWNAIISFLSPILNRIKNTFVTIFNAVKNTVTRVWNSIKSATTSAWNAVKNAVTKAVNAIKSVVTSVWNGIKTAVTSVMSGIKRGVTTAWNGIKSGVTTAVNAVKNTVTRVFNAVKSTATRVWNGIKTAITKPVNAAKDAVKTAIDKIKGFFSGLKLKLPNIKLPHFKITGDFSLNPPSVPKLKIDWYSKAMNSPMLLNSPTIFGHANGKLLGGGEAGSEMVGGANTVMQMIQSAVDRSMQAMNLNALVQSIEDLANRPNVLSVNGREFALATAADTDRVNGMRGRIIDRGVLLD